MRPRVLLSLLVALGCLHVHGAPLEHGASEHGAFEQGSCEDASSAAAARLALSKINEDRTDGYIFTLHRLSNVHTAQHGENGVVFYLTLDVVDTNCSVLSRKDWKTCEARPTHDTPTYGQCKVAIFINRVHRVVRLYKYRCVLRHFSGKKLLDICPDCPVLMSQEDAQVQKAVSLSLEKFNQESGLDKKFALLKVERATAGLAVGMYFNVEYSIQETTCARTAGADAQCPPMECEFAHKGFCVGTLHQDITVTVQCEIYEPEAAEREKNLHLLGAETDHSHNDTQAPGHEHQQAHAADPAHTHDHVHDHTKSHGHHHDAHKHADDAHHHTHDHAAGSAHRHAHDHSHDHGHGHDHVHAHHAKAHDHSGDAPNQHHDYKHADGAATHHHDHELALDHDHKHPHLHAHEHHHHHHQHEHEKEPHDHPDGAVRLLPDLGLPVTLPSFPDVPAGGPEAGVTLPLKPDPQIPGQREPTVQAFPTSVSAQCPPPAAPGTTPVDKAFAEDPEFKTSA
ncbi:fetuin B [Betta splendens]|uniref:Fetuin B n=1 Tax=Betta splendens TaxID=158456 RepID=A0A6P7ME03_BETSP|nr:fetuin B [Betta splendens]